MLINNPFNRFPIRNAHVNTISKDTRRTQCKCMELKIRKKKNQIARTKGNDEEEKQAKEIIPSSHKKNKWLVLHKYYMVTITGSTNM